MVVMPGGAVRSALLIVQSRKTAAWVLEKGAPGEIGYEMKSHIVVSLRLFLEFLFFGRKTKERAAISSRVWRKR